MSLKAIHILFVLAVILLSLGLAALFLRAYREGEGGSNLGWALGWVAVGVVMSVYGRRVVRKLRSLTAL